MKSCPICGREVVSKRKDAVFCKDAACRKKAQQARKEEAAKLPPAASSNKASIVVTFPDGNRWLLELTPLHGANPAQLPSLAQVAASSVVNSPGTAPAAATVPQTMDTAGSVPTTLAPAVAPEQTPPSTLPEPAPQKALRTVELYFTDENGRRVYFRDAVRLRPGVGWVLKPSAQVRLGFDPDEGYGLGGVPGRWDEFFPGRSPATSGLDADIGVIYADDNERREYTYAADPELLQQTLGADWRTILRTRANGDKSRPR